MLLPGTDDDRALVVGTTSFGKGLVQTVFPLEGGWALKMTTAKWYTPSGRSIQRERVQQPDGRLVEVGAGFARDGFGSQGASRSSAPTAAGSCTAVAPSRPT